MAAQALRFIFLLLTFSGSLLSTTAFPLESALELKEIYAKKVDRKLNLPADEQHYYAQLLLYTLQQLGLNNLAAQFILLTDRSPQVQAVLLFWLAEDGHPEFIGASPASTGKGGGYEYYETPLGIFEHSPLNLDFRAEGSKNKYGLMGYGKKGMRIYDFGWVKARKTWMPEMGEMRLQLHSTDPNFLEPRLGTAQSKGCIRIPATLNKLLDHYGVLDANYEITLNNRILMALDPAREPTPWPGKYLVIVDSRRIHRPEWSPQPDITAHPAKISLSASSYNN